MTNKIFRDPTRGFTLIELLIVIAIILILIAIALPNFLEAQVRAKVTASKGNMRAIYMAMNSLYIDMGSIHPDYNDFGHPELNPLVTRIRARIPDAGMGCLSSSRVCDCRAPIIPDSYKAVEFVASAEDFYAPGIHCPLTSPIAYISEAETADPFGMGVVPHGYDSFPEHKDGKLTGKLSYGAVFGIGPDGIAGDWLRGTPYTIDINGDGLAEGLPYSPTNGTKSHGDLWKVFPMDIDTANYHYNHVLSTF